MTIVVDWDRTKTKDHVFHATPPLLQAQKPWEKKYNKVMNAKKDYHTACRQEKSTANQENNARGDSSFSPDQVNKCIGPY